MSDSRLSEEDYYQALARKRSAAGAFLFNAAGEILIVKPGYKDYWSIPGGAVDANESPHAACRREIREEIGLDLEYFRLICVDHMPDVGFKGDSLQFIFESHVLTPEQISAIRVDGSEIIDFKICAVDEALQLISKNLNRRLRHSLTAIKNKTTVYLEEGVPV